MIFHFAPRNRRPEGERHEKFRRRPFEAKLRAMLKTEAAVVVGLAEHHAAGGAILAQAFENRRDERASYPSALKSRFDSDGSEPMPARAPLDIHGRNGHMADDRAVFTRGDVRQPQSMRLPQCIEEIALLLVAEGTPRKGRRNDGSNSRAIFEAFASYREILHDGFDFCLRNDK